MSRQEKIFHALKQDYHTHTMSNEQVNDMKKQIESAKKRNPSSAPQSRGGCGCSCRNTYHTSQYIRKRRIRNEPYPDPCPMGGNCHIQRLSI